MQTQEKKLDYWIKRQRRQSQPNHIYIRWLEKQKIKITTTAEVKTKKDK